MSGLPKVDNEGAREQWVRGEIPVWTKRYILFRYILEAAKSYLKLPHLSAASVIFFFLRIGCLVAISISPIIFFYSKISTNQFSAAEFPLDWAIWACVVVIGMQVYAFIYDRSIQGRAKRKQRQKHTRLVKERSASTINNLRPHLKFRPGNQWGKLQSTRGELLQAIHHEIRVLFEDFGDEYFQVSLLIFHDKACKFICVSDRAQNTRRIGGVFSSDKTLAYYAARAGKHCTLHDLKADNHPFPRKGLSAEDAPYRSILCVPIVDSTQSPYVTRGIITIDSEQPYHFSAKKVSEVIVLIESYCAILRMILANHPHSLKLN